MAHGLAAVLMSLAGLGLTWLLQSSALLALGLLAGRVLKRSGPAVQSGVYRTTLAAILVCPATSALLAGAGFDGFTLQLPSPSPGDAPRPMPADSGPSVRNAAAPEGVPGELTSTATAAESAPSSRPEPRGALEAPVTSSPARPPAPARSPAPSFPNPSRPALIALALAAWLIGSTALALRLSIGQWRMGRLRASAVRVEPEAEALCNELARRLRLSPPDVLCSPFLFSPCLSGLRRPAILLPEDASSNLRETFLHELAHLARRDGHWNLLRHYAVAALWVQPLLWVLSRRLEAAAEEVCDDYVVHFGADRARYAGHLLDLAGRALPPAAAAGVGMVSLRSMLARRIVRILDPSRRLSTRAGGRAVLAMLVAGLAGTTLAGLLGVGGPAREARARAEVVAAAPRSSGETIRGRVMGPDGTPVAGATVTASRPHATPLDEDLHGARVRRDIARTITDRDGRFAMAFDMPAPDDRDARGQTGGRNVQVIATAPGFGIGYALGDAPIRLTAGDLPVTGRLVDLEGRPVAGARVCVVQLVVPNPLAHREPGGAAAMPPSAAERGLWLDGEAALPGGVETGADGRFRIEGLGRDTLAMVEITGPTLAYRRARILTRAMDRFTGDLPAPEPGGLDEPGILGADCTIVVAPGRPIEGVVRDLLTGEPIPGAVVTAAQVAGSTLNVEGLISAETDARGRYRLTGLPKADGHTLSVVPPLDRPYFATRFLRVPAGPGADPVRFDVALRPGIWITGKVTDAATGKPVAASVGYLPFLANAHARDYPNFNPDITASIDDDTRHRTDRSGQYRVVGLPGRGVIAVRSDDRGYRMGIGAGAIEGRTEQKQLLTYDRIWPDRYHALKEVDPSEGAGEATCDVALVRGGSVKLRLVDPGGAPLRDVVVDGRYPEGVDHGDRGPGGESVASIVGLEPGRSRTVVLGHGERRLGAVIVIPADGPEAPEMTVTLHPCATLTGRLVDDEGRPARGVVRVRIRSGHPSVFAGVHVADLRLDPAGRFRCDTVPPGGRFVVEATSGHSYGFGAKDPDGFASFALAADLPAGPGQSIDLGTFDVKAARRIDAPAAKPGPAGLPVTGRIVDLEGRPVAGVSVRVERVLRVKSDDLSPWLDAVKKGEPPWIAARHLEFDTPGLSDKERLETKTDGDGRFHLEGLGGEQVVDLKMQGETIAAEQVELVTRRIEPVAAKGFASQYGPGTQTIYGAEFTHTARLGRPVEGVVVDAKTREPMAGVAVESYRLAGSTFVGTKLIRTTSDARGRFRLVGLPKGKDNMVMAVPSDDQPYFQREVTVADPPGIAPVSVEIELHRGIWITGKVTDKRTGEPVKDCRLHYLPFLENTHVQGLPEFENNHHVHGDQMRYKTAADGTYRLVGMPGRAIVGVETGGGPSYRRGVGSERIAGMDKYGHFKTYYNPIWPGRLWPLTMKEINPDAGAERVELDLQLDPGLSVRLKVVDASGAPVSGYSVVGFESNGRTQTFADAEFTAVNFAPDEERTVIVRHGGRQLGKVLRVKAGSDAGGPVAVTLEPLATIRGRAVDADGNPVPAATVRPDFEPSGDFSPSLDQVASGRDGRFTVAGVPTGCDYSILVELRPFMKDRRSKFVTAQVRPGEPTDLGDVALGDD